MTDALWGKLVSSFVQARVSGSRSTVLAPLNLLLTVLLPSTIVASVWSPAWIATVLVVSSVVVLLLYRFAYTFCLFQDKDALRSESYSLEKLRMDRGLLGDSTSGVEETKRDQELIAAPATQVEEEEEEK